MSIKPVSDIVLDVANAADPVRSLRATERLARLGPGGQNADNGFSIMLSERAMPRVADGALGEQRYSPALMGGKSQPALPPVDAGRKAYKGLEQLILQSLVETMLPKDATEIFGHGAAGDIWRSMLAEQLATQIGKSVDLGLVKTRSAGHGSVAAFAEVNRGGHASNSGDAFANPRS